MSTNLKSLIIKNRQRIIAEYGSEFWDYINEEISGKHFHLWEDFAKMFVENIAFKGKLLDFGCGFGVESMLLSSHCSSITGIDLDKIKISVFKKLLKQTGIKNIKAQVVDGENMPFRQKSFDFAFCNESLSHVGNIEKALAEIFRVLKTGGKIIVADTKRWHPYGLFMIYIKRDFEENYFNIWTMKRLLAQAGYKDIKRVKYITAPRQPLRRWRHQLWPFLQFADPKYVLVGTKE